MQQCVSESAFHLIAAHNVDNRTPQKHQALAGNGLNEPQLLPSSNEADEGSNFMYGELGTIKYGIDTLQQKIDDLKRLLEQRKRKRISDNDGSGPAKLGGTRARDKTPIQPPVLQQQVDPPLVCPNFDKRNYAKPPQLLTLPNHNQSTNKPDINHTSTRVGYITTNSTPSASTTTTISTPAASFNTTTSAAASIVPAANTKINNGDNFTSNITPNKPNFTDSANNNLAYNTINTNTNKCNNNSTTPSHNNALINNNPSNINSNPPVKSSPYFSRPDKLPNVTPYYTPNKAKGMNILTSAGVNSNPFSTTASTSILNLPSKDNQNPNQTSPQPPPIINKPTQPHNIPKNLALQNHNKENLPNVLVSTTSNTAPVSAYPISARIANPEYFSSTFAKQSPPVHSSVSVAPVGAPTIPTKPPQKFFSNPNFNPSAAPTTTVPYAEVARIAPNIHNPPNQLVPKSSNRFTAAYGSVPNSIPSEVLPTIVTKANQSRFAKFATSFNTNINAQTNTNPPHNPPIIPSNPLTNTNTAQQSSLKPHNTSYDHNTSTSTSSSSSNTTVDTTNTSNDAIELPITFEPPPVVAFPPHPGHVNVTRTSEILPFVVEVVDYNHTLEFFQSWAAQDMFAWCLLYKSGITAKNPALMNNADEDEDEFLPSKVEVLGICVCWQNALVNFLPLYHSLKPDSQEETKQDNEMEGVDESDTPPDPDLPMKMNDERVVLSYRWQCVKHIMEHSRACKILFNMKSQLKMFMAQGIYVRGPVDDPKIAAWMLDAEKNKERGLLELLQDYAKQKSAFYYDPKSGTASPFEFSCVKAHHSLLLSRVFQDKVSCSKREQNVYKKIEMPLIPILAEMEFNGIGFKNEIIQKNKKVIEAKERFLENKAYELAGRKFDLGCLTDLSEILYNHLNLPPPQDEVRNVKRARKAYSTNAEVLTKLGEKHELPIVIMEWRKLRHLVSCYLDLLSHHSFYDNRFGMHRIYSTILQTSAPTGRLAMNYPNLQSISNEVTFSLPPSSFLKPQKDSGNSIELLKNSNSTNTSGSGDKAGNSKPGSAESDPNASALGELDLSFVNKQINKINNEVVVRVRVRDAFVPSEGCIFLSADYCQIEFRLLAYLSKDQKLTSLLNQKHDVFRLIAAQVHQKQVELVTEGERGNAKQLAYGLLYGMGCKTLSEKLNMTERNASDYLKAFKAKFDGFAKFFEQVTKDCEKNGFVETKYGRRRYLPHICSENRSLHNRAVRQAINTVCQGTAADVMKKAMVVIVKRLRKNPNWKARMLLQLHDEILFEVDKSQMKDLYVLVKTTMESVAEKDVGHLPVKVCVGGSWGSLEPMEDPRSL